MAGEIYLAEEGRQIGPLGADELRRMIQEGRAGEGTYAWTEGAPDWKPLGELMPDLFAMTVAVSARDLHRLASPTAQMEAGSAPTADIGGQAQRAPEQSAPGKAPTTRFEVVVSDFHRMPKITLDDDAVVLEAGALHYMLGSIAVEAPGPSEGGPTDKKAERPVYRGTGTIFLEPTFGECTVLDLAGDEWILDRGAFLACDTTISVDVFTSKAWAGTRVSGHGKVLVHSPGPLERIELKGETLVVDGSFAVARTAAVDFSVEQATGKLFGAWASGEGLLRTFRGNGTVLIAPVPNRFTTLLGQFAHLRAALRALAK
jgi:uncharacterized protein (AIM24 family)